MGAAPSLDNQYRDQGDCEPLHFDEDIQLREGASRGYTLMGNAPDGTPLGDGASGMLEYGDQKLPDGSYIDVFVLFAYAGDTIDISATSDDFVPSIVFVQPNGEHTVSEIPTDAAANERTVKLSTTAVETDDYEFFVSGRDSASMGSFSVELSISTPP